MQVLSIRSRFPPARAWSAWFILPTSGTLPPNSSPAERFCKDLTTAIPGCSASGDFYRFFGGNGVEFGWFPACIVCGCVV